MYEQWTDREAYRINNYPGDGYICKYTVKWMPGMAGDFRCLRFSDALDTNLPYWIESYTAFSTATVHVRLGRSAKVYLHYGNGTARSESNGAAVYEFFDGFTGNALDGTKWPTMLNSVTYSIDNGVKVTECTKNAGAYWIYNATDAGSQLQCSWPLANAFTVECDYEVSDTAINQMGSLGLAIVGSDNLCSAHISVMDDNAAEYSLKTGGIFAEGYAGTGVRLTPPTANGSFKISRNGTALYVSSRETVTGAWTQRANNTSNDISKIAIVAGGYGPYPYLNYGKIMNVRVRKYTATEPAPVLIGGGSFMPPHSKLTQFYIVNQGFKISDGVPIVYRDWSRWIQYRVADYPGEGYILKLTVSWLPGMKSDFADLRFSDALNTKLSYWVEEYTAFGTATVHIRLARSSTVYLHYGNGAAVSESNGDNTFEFFDGFSGAAIDTNKWTLDTAGTTTATITNGELVLFSALGNANRQTLRTNRTFTYDHVLEYKVKQSAARYISDTGFSVLTASLPPTGAGCKYRMAGGYAANSMLITYVAVSGSQNALSNEAADTYYKMKLQIGRTYQSISRDGITQATRQDSLLNVAYKLFIFEYSPYNNTLTLTFDDVRVRKYIATDPTAVMVTSGERRKSTAWLFIRPQTLAFPRSAEMNVESAEELTGRSLGNARTSGVYAATAELLTTRLLTSNRSGSVEVHVADLSVAREGHLARAGLSNVNVSKLLTDRELGSARISDFMVTPVDLLVGRVTGHARTGLSSVKTPEIITERDLFLDRQAGTYVKPVDLLTNRTARQSAFAYMRVASVNVLGEQTDFTYGWPAYPYSVFYEIDGDAVVGSTEVNRRDIIRIVGLLHDTDPYSTIDRLTSFAGYTVKAVLRGGHPAQTIIKDCNTSAYGRVECRLSATDLPSAGTYLLKFVLLGVHESVADYRKELPERRADVLIIRVNDPHVED